MSKLIEKLNSPQESIASKLEVANEILDSQALPGANQLLLNWLSNSIAKSQKLACSPDVWTLFSKVLAICDSDRTFMDISLAVVSAFTNSFQLNDPEITSCAAVCFTIISRNNWAKLTSDHFTTLVCELLVAIENSSEPAPGAKIELAHLMIDRMFQSFRKSGNQKKIFSAIVNRLLGNFLAMQLRSPTSLFQELFAHIFAPEHLKEFEIYMEVGSQQSSYPKQLFLKLREIIQANSEVQQFLPSIFGLFLKISKEKIDSWRKLGVLMYIQLSQFVIPCSAKDSLLATNLERTVAVQTQLLVLLMSSGCFQVYNDAISQSHQTLLCAQYRSALQITLKNEYQSPLAVNEFLKYSKCMLELSPVIVQEQVDDIWGILVNVH